MPDRPLQGVGVLVTRPRTQATELVDAIEEQGGTAYCFPVIDIAAFDELDIRNSVSRLAKPDIVIFVSATSQTVASFAPTVPKSYWVHSRYLEI